MPRYLMAVFGAAEPGPLGGYPSREVMRQAFTDTGAFNERLERDGNFVFADGLAAPSTATVVDGQGETPIITDGPYLEAKEYIGGFWVVDATDLDEVLALAADASRACRRKVEVRPFNTEESIRAMTEQ